MYKYDIKKRREELELSLQDVADNVGVNKSTVMKWEQGRIDNMKRDRIALLAKALKITPEEFMGWDAPIVPTKKEQKMIDTYMQLKNSDDPKLRALATAVDRLLGIDE